MPAYCQPYFGRRAAGRAALRLSRPTDARPADFAGFLVGVLTAPFADFFTAFLAAFAAAGLAAFTVLRAAAFLGTDLPLSRYAIADPSSAGERTVVIPAASSAANFAAAVP